MQQKESKSLHDLAFAFLSRIEGFFSSILPHIFAGATLLLLLVIFHYKTLPEENLHLMGNLFSSDMKSFVFFLLIILLYPAGIITSSMSEIFPGILLWGPYSIKYPINDSDYKRYSDIFKLPDYKQLDYLLRLSRDFARKNNMLVDFFFGGYVLCRNATLLSLITIATHIFFTPCVNAPWKVITIFSIFTLLCFFAAIRFYHHYITKLFDITYMIFIEKGGEDEIAPNKDRISEIIRIISINPL